MDEQNCTSTAYLPQEEPLTEEQEKQIQDFIENRFIKVLQYIFLIFFYERTDIMKIKQDVEFIKFCKETIADYVNKHVDKTDNVQITTDDVYVVWICKALQNWKALVSTTLSDGMYYEITHNGDKNETYIDVYKKRENFVVR